VEDLFINSEFAKNRFSSNTPPLHLFLYFSLQNIKRCPDKFVESFAKQRSIAAIMNPSSNINFEGEIKCISLLVEELQKRLADNSTQLIPILYHFRNHGFIMSTDIDKLDDWDTRTEPEHTYEFGCSKQSSDNFLIQLIAILNERKTDILNIYAPSSNCISRIAEGDSRITCKIGKIEIRNYFLKLNSKNRFGLEIMSEHEIDHFLHTTFAAFEFDPKFEIKKFTPKIRQADLGHFIYRFYFDYANSNNESEIYAALLKDKFTAFKNYVKLSTIQKKFCTPPPKFPPYLM
jgi:hypothetical protein